MAETPHSSAPSAPNKRPSPSMPYPCKKRSKVASEGGVSPPTNVPPNSAEPSQTPTANATLEQTLLAPALTPSGGIPQDMEQLEKSQPEIAHLGELRGVIAEGVNTVAEAEGAVLESLSSHVRTVVSTLGGMHGAARRPDKWQHLHAGFTIWLSESEATVLPS